MPRDMYKTLGQIAYDIAAVVTGEQRKWNEIGLVEQDKWINAANGMSFSNKLPPFKIMPERANNIE